jgi:hypothetical protein
MLDQMVFRDSDAWFFECWIGWFFRESDVGFQDWIGWFFRDSDVWFSGLDRLVFRIQDIGVFFSVADTKIYKSQVERKLFRLMAAFAR